MKSCEKNSQDLAGELERLRERRSDQLFQYRSDRDEILAKVVESFDCVSVFYADGRCIYDWDKSGHLALSHSLCARTRTWKEKVLRCEHGCLEAPRMDGTGKNEVRCKPETAVHSSFSELRCLEIVKSEGEI